MSKKVEPAEMISTVTEGPVELENQFILRLPAEPAKALREAVRSGSNNLKERLTVKLEPDMRHGEVRFDHWLLHARLMDLPTIMESLKTIDNKNFYKTADICQLLVCSTEEEPPPPPEEEAPKKKKDPNKVDKKYLWPHGVTPPMKNVRKRRFRKTLKKKYVEAPEIEKEVKRLLRVDNEAVNVKWEIISEDQLLGPPEPGVEVEDTPPKEKEGKRSKKSHKEANLAEHDIFGEAVSDSDADDDSNSDEDDTKGIDVLNLDDEESSRLMMSAGEDSLAPSQDTGGASTSTGLVTQFSKEMFSKPDSMSPSSSPVPLDAKEGRGARDLELRAARLRIDLEELHAMREQRQQQQEMAGDNENVALRQRFSEIFDEQIAAKERELQQVLDSM
ncbi:transcription initiation factor TFIID subunit 7-like [Neocloeon triangulifer]|uniref:transcription initiation factor TFIID subunit 7-like n=1 Tax=Neocloeon triangulifer TaxID=2078957 RepID=UPI00286F614B|nr:transcription initiation factor TFIID subunit 7-like [Neocloeon triangulifer]